MEIEPYIYNKVEKLRFRIKGRKDNVICSGGIKIQIEEVETLLKPHLEKPFMLAKKKDGKFGEIAVLLTEDEDIKSRGDCSAASYLMNQKNHLIIKNINIGFLRNSDM